ncbi:MAG TPA: SPFH domain-containing protein [Oligoflexia bacterium]|nr:SPFH domain-containing protein [Oligoflexia bacterium]HMP48554.1 SPFH domain-containing protein [Oligoflexia bacterium]
MSAVLIFFPIVLLLAFSFMASKSIKMLAKNERGVIFRLGRLKNVLGPGLVIIVPFIDKMERINLDDKISGWSMLREDQLRSRIIDIATRK